MALWQYQRWHSNTREETTSRYIWGWHIGNVYIEAIDDDWWRMRVDYWFSMAHQFNFELTETRRRLISRWVQTQTRRAEAGLMTGNLVSRWFTESGCCCHAANVSCPISCLTLDLKLPEAKPGKRTCNRPHSLKIRNIATSDAINPLVYFRRACHCLSKQANVKERSCWKSLS